MVKKVIIFFAGIVVTIIIVRFAYSAINNGLNLGGNVINNAVGSVFGTDEKIIGDIKGEKTDVDAGNLGTLGEQKEMSDLFK